MIGPSGCRAPEQPMGGGVGLKPRNLLEDWQRQWGVFTRGPDLSQDSPLLSSERQQQHLALRVSASWGGQRAELTLEWTEGLTTGWPARTQKQDAHACHEPGGEGLEEGAERCGHPVCLPQRMREGCCTPVAAGLIWFGV